MNVKAWFHQLFGYDAWANAEILDVLRQAESELPEAQRLLNHIVGVEFLWLARLRGEQPGRDIIWPVWNLEECSAKREEISGLVRGYLDEIDRYDAVVAYKNSAGKSFQTPIEEILTHVVTHSAYHRGQIASWLRQHGMEPRNTDYITYVRKQHGQL